MRTNSSSTAARHLTGAFIIGVAAATATHAQSVEEMLLRQRMLAAGQQYAQQAAQALQSQSVVNPKKPAVPRLGIQAPTVKWGKEDMGFEMPETFKQVLIVRMSGPVVDLVPLSSHVPLQLSAELKEKEVDYVLHTSIEKGQSSPGWKKALRTAAPVISMIPMVGVVGGAATAAVGISAAVALQSVAAVAASTRAKDELVLTYSLKRPEGGAPVLEATSRAKAKKDGEDLLLPLIDEAAKAIVQQVAEAK